MKLAKLLFALLFVGGVTFAPGCEEEGPAEETGETIDEGLEDTQEGLEDTTEDLDEGLETDDGI